MASHSDQIPEPKTQTVANTSTQKKVDANLIPKLVDNHPGVVAQRQLEETINSSPGMQQLKSIQLMADHSIAGKIVQREVLEEEEPIQGKFEVVQKKDNNTGLPDSLKTGVENLSGFSMDDVKVHYNSYKPAQLQAHAYAQGTAIHIAPGQEQHLPHEAWHVVQQKQGRVQPTMQMKGKLNINDDVGLEQEADRMGTRALQFIDNHPESISQRKMQSKISEPFYAPIQLMKKWTKGGGFEDIDEAPVVIEDVWLRCIYRNEETYIKVSDMEGFTPEDWGYIEYYDDSSVDDEAEYQAEEEKLGEDEFPSFNVGEVTSITIIKESRSDHQYVIAMVKGGGNIKLHYGAGGGLSERSNDIDKDHGIPVEHFSAPEGLTGDQVIQIFESTKVAIASKFEGGNCGGLASELVSKLGGISIGSDFF